ncbi:MAG: division/cell wall cluster transcriptional repressor MraZ [Bacilli bacterium]|nr:division/cell wall cluster transcriptional repressor MraZ [Bacilli bacterium]MBR4351331.1 division/cell wall cluster transcriptional repressor MraZ [Bacilli bacterium]
MLMGEFHHNLDDKNRLIIPSKFRYELGSKFIVTRGIEKCLFVYPVDEWNKIIEKLNTLPFTNKDARTFMRMFLSGATECELDNNGRVQITGPLMNYASLNKECVVIGVGDRLEIWDQDMFNNFFNDNIENFSDVAENLFSAY